MESATQLFFVYITTPTIDEAKKIGQYLVEENLAACVNVVPGMLSIYKWDGRIEESDETILIAKTNGRKRDMLIQQVREHHSYDVPSIVAIPITAGNPDYMTWLNDNLT